MAVLPDEPEAGPVRKLSRRAAGSCSPPRRWPMRRWLPNGGASARKWPGSLMGSGSKLQPSRWPWRGGLPAPARDGVRASTLPGRISATASPVKSPGRGAVPCSASGRILPGRISQACRDPRLGSAARVVDSSTIQNNRSRRGRALYSDYGWRGGSTSLRRSARRFPDGRSAGRRSILCRSLLLAPRQERSVERYLLRGAEEQISYWIRTWTWECSSCSRNECTRTRRYAWKFCRPIR